MTKDKMPPKMPSLDKENSKMCETIEISDELNNKERFLLHYLRNRKVSWKIDEPVKNLFDDYESTLFKLRQNGYLQDDEHSYFLEVANIEDLKSILRTLSLPVSGKKSELIERILTNTTEEQRSKICTDVYYVLSAKGILLDEEYKAQRKQESTSLKESMQQKISNGEFLEASLIMGENYSNQVISTGIGMDWSNQDSIKMHSKAKIERIEKYDFSDLKNSAEYINLIKKVLYYDSEIEHNLFKSISTFILPFGELIQCPDLDVFFKRKGYTPSEICKVYVYIDTKRYNAFQSHMRDFLKKDNYKPLPNGEFKVADSTLAFWKEFDEFKTLSQKEIPGFPKTFQTFQKHKHMNSDKYKSWLL